MNCFTRKTKRFTSKTKCFTRKKLVDAKRVIIHLLRLKPIVLRVNQFVLRVKPFVLRVKQKYYYILMYCFTRKANCLHVYLFSAQSNSGAPNRGGGLQPPLNFGWGLNTCQPPP